MAANTRNRQAKGEGRQLGMEGFKQPCLHGSWRNKRMFQKTFAPSPSSGSRNGALAGRKPLMCPHHMQP